MGYRISWLAAHGVGKDRLLGALSLMDIEELDEANEACFSIADLPTGWTVLWANDESYASEHAAELSRAGFAVLAAHVNETCMHCTSELFEHGSSLWRLHHEGDERIDFLEVDGTPPDQTHDIEAVARSRQAEEDAGLAGVDYLFEIPLDVAKAVCGYKHDQWRFDWGEPAFTVVVQKGSLSNNQRQRAGFISHLFGRP